MWDKPINLFEKVKNPTETDETEDEKNELVILDDADNWFPVSLSILHFSQNKDLGIPCFLLAPSTSHCPAQAKYGAP